MNPAPAPYRFEPLEEVKWAVITFVVFVGAAFIATGDNPVNNWSDWLQITALSGARAAVAGLVNGFRAVLSSRG